jgi:hypothetical protein
MASVLVDRANRFLEMVAECVEGMAVAGGRVQDFVKLAAIAHGWIDDFVEQEAHKASLLTNTFTDIADRVDRPEPGKIAEQVAVQKLVAHTNDLLSDVIIHGLTLA